MPDKETVKKRLLEMIEECNVILSRYKDLRANGLSKDEAFETSWNIRKKTIVEILDLISK